MNHIEVDADVTLDDHLKADEEIAALRGIVLNNLWPKLG